MEAISRPANSEQLAGLLRQVILTVGGFAIGRGWLSEDVVTMILSLIPILAVVGWGWWARTDKSLIQSAASVPVVDKVVVSPEAERRSHALTENPKVTS